jgi:hypothetical protein
MCGVLLMREPYALIARAEWSSVKMKRTFGRLAASAWGAAAKPQTKPSATSATVFLIMCFMEKSISQPSRQTRYR